VILLAVVIGTRRAHEPFKTVAKTCKHFAAQVSRSAEAVPEAPEFLDHFLLKGRDILRFSARDQAVVHHDFFIDPIRPGVSDISLGRGEKYRATRFTVSVLIRETAWSFRRRDATPQ